MFRLSRNPMYLGVYATLAASVFYTLNPVVLVVGVFVALAHHRIVLAEERFLARTFGSDFAVYCRRVRRYL
ncbi:MAG TPA: methyltransferase [Vicinamibacterales bacterium]